LCIFAEKGYEEEHNFVEEKIFDNEAGPQIKNCLEEGEKTENEVASEED
jgi:hypothetical protein